MASRTPQEPRRVEALVLRKTVYAETSLVLAVLTPVDGQLHFLLKGALRPSRRAFPAADLFRRLQIVYRPSLRGGLEQAREVDCLASFEAMAERRERYLAGVWLCQLALRNSVEHNASPRLYQALGLAFARLAEVEGPLPKAIVLAVCFALLDDLGLLPEVAPGSHQEHAMRRLLDFALLAAAPCPPYGDNDWHALGQWTRQFLLSVDHPAPEGVI